MSTNLKSTDMLKDAKCEKRQLAQRPPIPYVPVVDLVTPKEDPAVLKGCQRSVACMPRLLQNGKQH